MNASFLLSRSMRKTLRITTGRAPRPFNLPDAPLLAVDHALNSPYADYLDDTAYYNDNTVDADFQITESAEGDDEFNSLTVHEFDNVLDIGRFLNGYNVE